MLTFILVTSASLCSQESAGQAGAFLRVGFGPRAKAMGQAYTAIADQSTAAAYNPAGLGFIDQKMVDASVAIMSFDRRFMTVGFARSVPPTAGFSISVIQAGFRDIDARASNGDRIGSVDDHQFAVTMGFAIRLSDQLAMGISPRWLYSKVYDVSSSALGIGLGAMFKPRDNLSFGASVTGLGETFKFSRDPSGQGEETTRDAVPNVIRLGGAYRVSLQERLPLLAALDVSFTQDQPAQLHCGLEAEPSGKFKIRAGLDQSDWTFGFGIRWDILGSEMNLDYAFVHDTRRGVGSGSHDTGIHVRF